MFLLAFGASPVMGQGLEFSGGVNFAKLSGEAIDAAVNAGMNFGVDLVIPVGPIGLNIGADWSQKGVEQAVANATNVVDLSYIELPLHVRLPLVGAGPIRLNLIAGPTVGINTGCEISIDAAAAQDCADVAQGGFDVKGLDWAGTTGMGLSFRIGSIAYAGLDLAYTFGLTSIDEAAGNALKTRTFTLKSHVGFDVF
jgi:hypothetical protein